ncbi:MAG: flagellar biosynthesis repressor FlbT [Hyphomonadaceae bacterium]
MPLRISLRPGEKFVVNGAIVQNGDRGARLLLCNRVSLLLAKDIMQPEEARTPARRIYFPIMLMYLDEFGREQAYVEFVARLAEFMGAVRDADMIAECVSISNDVGAGEYYRALMRCRMLIAYEADLLGLDVSTWQQAAGGAVAVNDK